MNTENRMSINRDIVLCDYQSAEKLNRERFLSGDVRSTSEYIYENQKTDAAVITDKFYKENIRAISIVKRTKVGMDGLMIELAKNMSTHPDDDFALYRQNILLITGMSNKSWEDDMKGKMPAAFKDNVFHHGRIHLLKSRLRNAKDTLIIIDEIDNGDKEDQKMHVLLKESGILNIEYMEQNNIRFVFVSATMINELRDLCKWGDKHHTHYMSIPENYIGHNDFLEMGIIQEFYPVVDDESAERWVQEDIIQNYRNDYRVHIIRTDEKNKDYIRVACSRNNIQFKNHASDDRIHHEDLVDIFANITRHVVIAVKGFYRRANLIPNEWKLKIGATHERHVSKYDTNVQVQGLPGRMTGYWKDVVRNGFKTGPHRTSIRAMNEYDEFYRNPFERIRYSTNKTKKLFVNPEFLNMDCESEVDEKTNMRVPVIIGGLNETDIIFTTKNKKEKVAFLLAKLAEFPEYAKLAGFIQKDAKCIQITQPIQNNSYKKHITDVVNASLANRPYSVDLPSDKKHVNNWQMFIDNREKRMCIVVWSVDETKY